MASEWRQNIAELGWSHSEIRLCARFLPPNEAFYAVMIEGSDLVGAAQFSTRPDGQLDYGGTILAGVTMTSLWEDGLIEGD